MAVACDDLLEGRGHQVLYSIAPSWVALPFAYLRPMLLSLLLLMSAILLSVSCIAMLMVPMCEGLFFYVQGIWPIFKSILQASHKFRVPKMHTFQNLMPPELILVKVQQI